MRRALLVLAIAALCPTAATALRSPRYVVASIDAAHGRVAVWRDTVDGSTSFLLVEDPDAVDRLERNALLSTDDGHVLSVDRYVAPASPWPLIRVHYRITKARVAAALASRHARHTDRPPAENPDPPGPDAPVHVHYAGSLAHAGSARPFPFAWLSASAAGAPLADVIVTRAAPATGGRAGIDVSVQYGRNVPLAGPTFTVDTARPASWQGRSFASLYRLGRTLRVGGLVAHARERHLYVRTHGVWVAFGSTHRLSRAHWASILRSLRFG